MKGARNTRNKIVLALVPMSILVLISTFWLATFIPIPSGIGDTETAQAMIKIGMSKEEVRSILGPPNRDDDDQWDYWDSAFAGSILRVHFGQDNRVTSSEWWLN